MKELKDICRIPVKFSEIDSMRRVWHGSYVTYMEDGRESFGRRYPGIGYEDIERSGIFAPLYDLKIRYYAPLEINDVAIDGGEAGLLSRLANALPANGR